MKKASFSSISPDGDTVVVDSFGVVRHDGVAETIGSSGELFGDARIYAGDRSRGTAEDSFGPSSFGKNSS